jgi:tetratricopeptide (TPR) repeat protein
MTNISWCGPAMSLSAVPLLTMIPIIWMQVGSGPEPTAPVFVTAAEHLNRGIDWHVKKALDKAIGAYTEAIRLDPTSASAYCCRGLAWADKKDLDREVADDSEAIRLDPKHEWAYNNRGIVRAARKEFAEAIADFTEAIRLDPSFAVAHDNRARGWATCPVDRLRDGKRAVESATRACELTDWKAPAFLDTLAAAYAEAGDFRAAAETQARAIGLMKDYDARLKLYQDQKRFRDASETSDRLGKSRPWAFSSNGSRAFFTVPYDAILYLISVGGTAAAVTEFGLGTSEADHIPIFTGLPAAPEPNKEVKVGFVAAGSPLYFYEKTDWNGIRWAFSHDTKSKESRVAFQDLGNRLLQNGSIVEKTGASTWVLHLDDALSADFDDNNEDVLIEIRLVPASPPSKP